MTDPAFPACGDGAGQRSGGALRTGPPADGVEAQGDGIFDEAMAGTIDAATRLAERRPAAIGAGPARATGQWNIRR